MICAGQARTGEGQTGASAIGTGLGLSDGALIICKFQENTHGIYIYIYIPLILNIYIYIYIFVSLLYICTPKIYIYIYIYIYKSIHINMY